MDVKNIPDDLLIPWPEMEELPDHPISDGARTNETAFLRGRGNASGEADVEVRISRPQSLEDGDHTARSAMTVTLRGHCPPVPMDGIQLSVCVERFILEKGMIVTGNHIAARAMAQVGPPTGC